MPVPAYRIVNSANNHPKHKTPIMLIYYWLTILVFVGIGLLTLIIGILENQIVIGIFGAICLTGVSISIVKTTIRKKK